MKKIIGYAMVLLVIFVSYTGISAWYQDEISLSNLSPENYNYKEAARCANCKGDQNQFMARAVGVDFTAGAPKLDERGWLASVHARSQSHGERVNTACAWCHAPLAEGATKNQEEAKPIPKGTWQGVSCGACHPGSVPIEKRTSLISNYTPGTDNTHPDNYQFRDRTDGKEMNDLCRFCHHESHDLLKATKQEMMVSGQIRCIDCHMAAYAITDQHVERFHNFKVEVNLPHSCSGGMGRAMSCHDGVGTDWFKENLSAVKGPSKQWGSDS